MRYYAELGSWVIADRFTAQVALGHPGLSSRTAEKGIYLPPDMHEECAELLDVIGRWFVLLDGEAHTTGRRAVQRMFSPGRMRRVQDEIRDIVARAVDEFPEGGTQDAVTCLANVISARTMAHLLGLHDVPVERLHEWAAALADFLAASYRRDFAVRAQQALHEMGQALSSVDDEDSIWNLAVGDDRDRLATCSMVLFGGLETTASLIGLCLWYVLENNLIALVNDPDAGAATDSLIERVLELYPPLGHVARTAVTDLKVAGCPVAAGDLVLVSLTGNDPFATGAARPDRPAAHVPDSARPDHLAFGHSMHYCMGATLARMEASTLLSLFCQRFPTARVGEMKWSRNRTYRGFSHLRIEL
ncbi:cytochrome P450 [Streptomyces sp. NPDC002324]